MYQDTLKNNDSKVVHRAEQSQSVDNAVKIINAIGNQWPLILVIAGIIILIKKGNSILELFSKTRKLKIVGQELEFKEDVTFLPSASVEDASTKESSRIESIKEKNDEEKSELTIFDALEQGNLTEANRLQNIIIEGEDEQGKQKVQILFCYYKFIYGHNLALTELIDLKSKLTADPEILHYYYYHLGLSYSKGKNYENAISSFKSALLHLRNTSTIKHLAEALYDNGQKEDSKIFLLGEIDKQPNDHMKGDLYGLLGEYFDREKNNLLKALAYEKAVEFQSNNTTFLFKAAYSYSEESYELLSLNHYLQSTFFKKEEGALNNLGVSLGKFDLKYNSIRHYKESFELGGTLAASNLAYALIGIGFNSEADDILSKALKKEDVHQNVWSAKNYLESQIKNEEEKIASIKNAHFEQVNFIRNFAVLIFKTHKIDLKAIWMTENKLAVDMKIDNDSVVFVWKDSLGLTHSIITLGDMANAGFCSYSTKKETSYLSSDTSSFPRGMYYAENEELRFLLYKDAEFKFITLTKSV